MINFSFCFSKSDLVSPRDAFIFSKSLYWSYNFITFFSFSSNSFIFFEISCSLLWSNCPSVLNFFIFLFSSFNSFISFSFSFFILFISILFEFLLLSISFSFCFNFAFKSIICLFKLFLSLIKFFLPINAFSNSSISLPKLSFFFVKSEIFFLSSLFCLSKALCLLFKSFILFSLSFNSLLIFSISFSFSFAENNKFCFFSKSAFLILKFFNSFSKSTFFLLRILFSLSNFSICFLLFILLISISFSFLFNCCFKLFISLFKLFLILIISFWFEICPSNCFISFCNLSFWFFKKEILFSNSLFCFSNKEYLSFIASKLFCFSSNSFIFLSISCSLCLIIRILSSFFFISLILIFNLFNSVSFSLLESRRFLFSFFNFSTSLIILLLSINFSSFFFSSSFKVFICLFKLSFLLIKSCWFDIIFSFCPICSDNFPLSLINCKFCSLSSLYFSNNFEYFWLILFFSFSKSLKLSAFFWRYCILDLSDNKFASFNFNLDISVFKFFISFSFSLFNCERTFFSFLIFSNSLLILLLSCLNWFNWLFIWLIKSFWFDFCFNCSINFSFSFINIEICALYLKFSSNNCLLLWFRFLYLVSNSSNSFFIFSNSCSLFWKESICISLFFNWDISFFKFWISISFSFFDLRIRLFSFFNFSISMLLINICLSFFFSSCSKFFICIFKLLLFLNISFSIIFCRSWVLVIFSLSTVVWLFWFSFLIFPLFILRVFFSNFLLELTLFDNIMINEPISSSNSFFNIWYPDLSLQFLCFKYSLILDEIIFCSSIFSKSIDL